MQLKEPDARLCHSVGVQQIGLWWGINLTDEYAPCERGLLVRVVAVPAVA